MSDGGTWEAPDVHQATAAGRARWPELSLDDGAFARHLERAGVPRPVTAERGPELFLAAACAAGEPAALRVLEREYLAAVGSHLHARFHATDSFVDELRQAVRLRLVFDRPPRISSYNGSGPLGAFIRVVTVRLALDLIEARDRQPAAMDARTLARQLSDSPAVESELTRAEHGPRFHAAVEAAVANLTAREKALLRFHFLEGLNIDAIGRLYRVHRATVARWLVDVRSRIFQSVAERLAVEVRMSPSEFRSLVGLMREDLRLSFARVLSVKSASDRGVAPPAGGRR